MSKTTNIYLKHNINRTFSGFNDDPNPIEFFTNEESEFGVFLIPPDPNWEGNMYVPVIDELFNEIIKSNINVMRFSFIKYPIGVNDKYVKYIQQSSICFEEFLKTMPHVKCIIVVGYSFGALMALQLMLRRIEIMSFICISPPVLTYDFLPCLVPKNVKGAMIYGTSDTLIPEKILESYINCLILQKMQITSMPIAGADHYFTDKLSLMSKSALNYLNNSFKSKENQD